MSNMIPKLRHRVEICNAVQTPNADATVLITYGTLLTCWANVKPISSYVRALRGTNAGSFGESSRYGTATHVITIRKNSAELGYSFTTGFSAGFDTIIDLNPVKADMFLFLLKGSSKGRRFKVSAVRHDESWGEFLMIEAEELFEEGTGWGSLSQ